MAYRMGGVIWCLEMEAMGNLDQIIDHIGEFIKEEMSKNWVVIV